MAILFISKKPCNFADITTIHDFVTKSNNFMQTFKVTTKLEPAILLENSRPIIILKVNLVMIGE